MKIWVILCLAAGPLALYGQQVFTPVPAMTPPGAPMRISTWRPGPLTFLRDGRPAVDTAGGVEPWMSLYPEYQMIRSKPDGMPCLVPGRVNDRMKIDLRRNAEKMPNAMGSYERSRTFLKGHADLRLAARPRNS